MARVGKHIWAGTTEAFVHVLDPKTVRSKKKFKVIEASPVFSILPIEQQGVVWIGLEGHIGRVNPLKVCDFLGDSITLPTSLTHHIVLLVFVTTIAKSIGLFGRPHQESVVHALDW
jgi:hypothetical protein